MGQRIEISYKDFHHHGGIHHCHDDWELNEYDEWVETTHHTFSLFDSEWYLNHEDETMISGINTHSFGPEFFGSGIPYRLV